ncbi:MAG: helix-turn-helix domain-containing protein [Desulfurivibrionaceae bacterium]
MSGKNKGISQRALDLLHAYPFPGNVRELRNAMERAMAFCTTTEITPACLPERIRKAKTRPHPGGAPHFAELTGEDPLPTLEEMANHYTSFVLERLDGNKRQAARLLDISRATLYRRLGINGEKSS